jgi:hypothetical protein
MLVIRHRSGSLAGREQTIGDQSDRILFGRDADVCDVVFPADETLVSRRHFALERKLSGAWTIDLFGDPFVAVNGQPAETGQAVHSGDKIELGKRGGPAFELSLGDKEMTGKLAVTQAQEKFENPHAAAARARRLALVGVSLAVIAAGSAGAFMVFSANQGARLDQAVANLADTQAKAAAESFSPGIREKLLAASYVVVIRYASGQERATGTASPIGPSLLATNAHIVEVRDELGRGDKMFVRSPGPNGKSYEIIASQKHPAYDAFDRFLKEDALYVVSSKGCPSCFPSLLRANLSYDVGVLHVAEGSALSPILEIATPQELAAIKPGMPLAMAGYPLERIRGSEVQAIGATPTLSMGIATALTDMFNLPTDPTLRRLLQHNLPGTGGNSGSPMLATNGKLVALHNSGSYIDVPNVGRVPNAAMIRYGQRADLLLDLISGRANATLNEERAYWAKQTAAFKRGYEVIVPWILVQNAPQKGATPVLASEGKFALAKGDQFKAQDKNNKEVTRRQKIHAVNLRADRPTIFIAYAREQAPIQLYLVISEKIVEQDDRGIWYPDVTHKPAADTKAEIYVVSGDKDIEYTLLEYAWDAPRS